jgi:hypothetical protein
MGFLDDDKKEKLNTFVKFVKDQLELKTIPAFASVKEKKLLVLNNCNSRYPMR